MMLDAPNVTCFLVVNNRFAVLLNTEHSPYVEFCTRCLMLVSVFALVLSCSLSIFHRLLSVVFAFAISVRSSSAIVMHSSRKRSSCSANFLSVSRRCFRHFNLLSFFSILLRDSSDMEYLRSSAGVACWLSGVIVNMGISSAVCLGTWVGINALMSLLGSGNVVVILLLRTTVIHPSSSRISLLPYPPHRQSSFFFPSSFG